jgi:serine/threonine protein kinase
VTQPIAPSFCTRCGSPVNVGTHFCAVCGNDVSGSQSSLATEQMAAPRPAGPDAGWQEQLEHLREATIGEYELLGELGRGGMAAVYLAHEIALDRKVAIKVMSPALVHGDGMIERFKREARTAASLSHPNIIPIYAVRETDRVLFFVMKFVAGRPLDSVIKEVGPLPIPMVQMIMSQTGSAFGYAHKRGIIHRDIKPGNVMIDDDGWAVVTDFGIAKVSEAQGLTMTGMTVGTPTYMSPEQCMAQDVTGASDQYSLGVVAYEMITGRPPFQGGSMMAIMYGHFNDPPPPIEAVRPDCPENVRESIMRMLAKAPADRWPSMEDAVAVIGTPPSDQEKAIRATLQELGKKGEGTRMLQTLRTPTSQPPLTKRTKAATAAANAKTQIATGSAPRTQAARTQLSRPPSVAVGGAEPKSKMGLFIGLGLAVVVGGGALVLQPWKKPAPTQPPAQQQSAAPTQPVTSTAPPPAPPPAPQPVDSPVTAVAPPPPPSASQPSGPSAAELRRERDQYDGAERDALMARQRAIQAGATVAELRPGDQLRDAGSQSGTGKKYVDGSRFMAQAKTAYEAVEQTSRTRAQQLAVQQQAAQQQAAQQQAAPPPPPPVVTAPPPASPAAVDERPLVELALREYARAYDASDLNGMLRYFPNMGPDQQTALKEFWKNGNTMNTSRWEIVNVSLEGGTASVRIGGTMTMRDKKGKTNEVQPPRTARLEKASGGWRITSIQ